MRQPVRSTGAPLTLCRYTISCSLSTRSMRTGKLGAFFAPSSSRQPLNVGGCDGPGDGLALGLGDGLALGLGDGLALGLGDGLGPAPART